MNRRKFITASSAAAAGATTATAVSAPRGIISALFPAGDIQQPKYKPEPLTWSDREFTAAWLGHSTVLMNFFGTRIITDPILSDKAGVNILGLFTIGPKRIMAPALQREEIGRIDLILLSHAHMDHLDKPTMSSLRNSGAAVVMAKNTKDVIDDLEYRDIFEIDWGEKINKAEVEIEAGQVKHFGWRYPWEEDRSRGNRNGRSFNSYLVKKNGYAFVFGGDTAYTPAFKKIGARDEKIQLAIMPIGTYNPWIHAHCNPEQAVTMSSEMNAKMILPIHWDTFIMSDEPVAEPIHRLKSALKQTDIVLALDEIGKSVKVEERS